MRSLNLKGDRGGSTGIACQNGHKVGFVGQKVGTFPYKVNTIPFMVIIANVLGWTAIEILKSLEGQPLKKWD